MLTGSCHCGKTKFEVDGALPEKLTRCTCSICSKKGALYAFYTPEQFRLVNRPEETATYRWQTKQVAHNFCRVCGCATFNDSPAFNKDHSWDGKTRRIAINARLLDGFDAADYPVMVIDGKNLW